MKFLELLSLMLVICCGVAYSDNSNENQSTDDEDPPENPGDSSANPVSPDAVPATSLKSDTPTNKCPSSGIQFQFFEKVRIP